MNMTTTHTCTVKDAAEILKVHTATVEKLIAAGDIPAGRVGRSYVILTRDVLKYAERVILNQTADRLTKGRRPRSIHASLRIA